MDGAENAEVGNGTSSTIRSAENSPSDMAEDAEFDGNSDDGNDKTVKRSPLFKMSSGPMGYLTSLRSEVDSAPLAKR